MLWPWPSVHLGQLAPTTLPQCRLVSNPCSAGLLRPLALWHVKTCHVRTLGAQRRPDVLPSNYSVQCFNRCHDVLQRRPVQYHSKWFAFVRWLPTYPGQLAPTTLPQCRLVSNSRSAGLSLPFSLSLHPCLPLSLSLCVCLALSLLPPLCLPSPSPGVFLVPLPHLTPPYMLSPVRHIAVRTAVCSAVCRGTAQRLQIPGPLA